MHVGVSRTETVVKCKKYLHFIDYVEFKKTSSALTMYLFRSHHFS